MPLGNTAMTRIFALLIGLVILAADRAAVADIAARQTMFCSEAQMSNQGRAKTMPDELLVRFSEVIVDAIIESYRPSDGTRPGLAILRIEKVWKGVVPRRVALPILPPPPYYVSEWPSPKSPQRDCSNPVRAGLQLRIGATIADGPGYWSSSYPEIDANMKVLGGGRFFDLVYLPLRDPDLERLLSAYQAKTDALRQAATAGDLQARLAFAAHLYRNRESHRASEIADALRQDGVNLAPLGEILLIPERKEWSDLKRIHAGCYSDHGDFDAAVFDRADFAGCAFRYSSFRYASFRGTDLTGSYFQNSDLTGAQYDCATKLPEDLDPKAAGMINVEGQCAAP